MPHPIKKKTKKLKGLGFGAKWLSAASRSQKQGGQKFKHPTVAPSNPCKAYRIPEQNCTPLAALLDQTSLRCTCNHCKHSMTSSLNREPVNPEKTTTEQLNDVGMLKVSYFDVQDVPQSRGIGLSANPETLHVAPS